MKANGCGSTDIERLLSTWLGDTHVYMSHSLQLGADALPLMP